MLIGQLQCPVRFFLSFGFTDFGIQHTFRGFDGVSKRSAFLIDADGTVRDAWLYDISQVPDLDAILAAARALRLSPASS